MINGNLFFKSRHVDGADGQQPWTGLPAAFRIQCPAFSPFAHPGSTGSREC
ncbi:MAG: hypothetical protein ACOYD3_04725 [Kiritimatiellia bacterium]